MAVFDLPAKAAATNMVQFNGKYGCNYCTDKGETVNSRRVYPPTAAHTTRTCQDVENWAASAERSKTPVKGVKGFSILSELLQLPECIPIDYMHAILEGVFKRLFLSWTSTSSHHKPYYLGPYKKLIDKMASRIKPPSDFSRTLRSIDLIKYWKASEFRAWLLHYSIPLLKDFLPPEYLHHFALLVSATYILLSEKFSQSELLLAEKMLSTFYTLVPSLYPIEMLTANMHSLIHLTSFVKLWGPLWAYSMFGFENMNGYLKTTYHGTRQVVNQLISNLLLKQQFSLMIHQPPKKHQNMTELSNHLFAIGKVFNHQLSSSEKTALCNYLSPTSCPDTVTITCRILRNLITFHSCFHKQDGARNN